MGLLQEDPGADSVPGGAAGSQGEQKAWQKEDQQRAQRGILQLEDTGSTIKPPFMGFTVEERSQREESVVLNIKESRDRTEEGGSQDACDLNSSEHGKEDTEAGGSLASLEQGGGWAWALLRAAPAWCDTQSLSQPGCPRGSETQQGLSVGSEKNSRKTEGTKVN